MPKRTRALLAVAGAGVLVGSLMVPSRSFVDAAPGPEGAEIEIKDDIGTGAINVTVDSMPEGRGSVTVTNTVPVTGTVSVGNLPGTQAVTGSVSVANTTPIPVSLGSAPVAVTPSAPVRYLEGGNWALEGGDPEHGVKEFGTGGSPLVIDRINARCRYLWMIVLKFYSGGAYRTMQFTEASDGVINVPLGDVVVDANSFFTVHAFTSLYGGTGNCTGSASGFNGVVVTGHR